MEQQMFSVKDGEKELYFQIEKTKESLNFISKLSYKIFGKEGYVLEGELQGISFKKENYFCFEENGVYMIFVLGGKCIHLILLGLPKAKKIKIKEFVFDNFKFRE